ncbi:unnamed protein product [Urochloa decumbens]|uniref:Uncharacterized protein n=1 Tax=Urochloa decumbens TaxID=240449 RepID=A0ABC9AMH1_9POAL
MLTGKASVLLLLVLATVPLYPVTGCWPPGCNNRCKVARKNYILSVCHPYIRISNLPRVLPTKDHLCCVEVRTLQTNSKGGMQCVVDMLTHDELGEYNVTVMLYLGRYCTHLTSAAPHEVVV